MIPDTIAAFFDLLTRGLTAPRATARVVIDRKPALRDRLLMVGLAAAMQGALWALASLLAPGLSMGLGGMLWLGAMQFLNYVIVATAAYHIGRWAGGAGAAPDVATAVAWQSLLIAALTPLQAGAVAAIEGAAKGQISAPGLMMMLFYACLNVWLLAACVAEAHRFVSTGKVALAIFGLGMLLTPVMMLFQGGLHTP